MDMQYYLSQSFKLWNMAAKSGSEASVSSSTTATNLASRGSTSNPNIQEQYPMISEIVEDRIFPFVAHVLQYIGFG